MGPSKKLEVRGEETTTRRTQRLGSTDLWSPTRKELERCRELENIKLWNWQNGIEQSMGKRLGIKN